MSKGTVAVIGAGPYGLVSRPSQRAGTLNIASLVVLCNSGLRLLMRRRSVTSNPICAFGTNISSPTSGFSFADYNTPRGLETFEPCSMANFGAIRDMVSAECRSLGRTGQCSAGTKSSGRFCDYPCKRRTVPCFKSDCRDRPVVLCQCPLWVLATLPACSWSAIQRTCEHSVRLVGRRAAVIGAGQSALEAVVVPL